MIAFQANGRAYRTRELGYIESAGGYCLDVVIDRELRARARTRLNCWSARRMFAR